MIPKRCRVAVEGAQTLGRIALFSASMFVNFLATGEHSFGAVSSLGDVVPAPPSGSGNVASDFRVGDTDLGTLTINNGSFITVTGANGMFLGDTVDGIGIVNVTGYGSDLAVNSFIVVGNEGAGAMSVDELAVVSISGDSVFAQEEGSFAEVLIADLGTIWDNGDDMAIGDLGRAVVEITDGARLLSDTTDIGNAATGDGRVTLSGAFSLWRSTGPLQIGDNGRGRLEILDQARVENTNTFVGAIAGSVGAVEVDGEGSWWDTSGFMTIGNFGRGSLTITGKGRVSSGDARIGDNTSALGDVLVDGFGSVWNITGVLNVSEPGEAYLTISNDGLVTATGIITVAARGKLTLDGGRIEGAATSGLINQGIVEGSGTIHTTTVNNSTAASEIRLISSDLLKLTGTLSNAGLVDMQGGELEVLNTTTNTSRFDVRDGAVLRFHGNGLANKNNSRLAITSGIVDVFGEVDNNSGAQIIVGSEANGVFHDEVTNNGQIFVQPGGRILMLDDLSFSTGATLAVGLAAVDLTQEGVDPDDGFGQLQIGGSAALDGTLDVELVGGYAPVAGDMFQIVTAAGPLTGTFATELLPALSAGLSWDVLYDEDSVTLAVIGASLAGDYNQNGIVDAADYTVWRDTLGQMGAGLVADGDGSGTVDAADYDVWKTNFGVQAAGAAGSSVAEGVPEPAAWLLIAVGSLVGAFVARRPAHVAAS